MEILDPIANSHKILNGICTWTGTKLAYIIMWKFSHCNLSCTCIDPKSFQIGRKFSDLKYGCGIKMQCIYFS